MGILNYIFISLISLAVGVPITHHDDCGHYSNRYCLICHQKYLEIHYKFYHGDPNDLEVRTVFILKMVGLFLVVYYFIVKPYIYDKYDVDLKFTDIFKFIIRNVINIFKVVKKVIIYVINLFRKSN